MMKNKIVSTAEFLAYIYSLTSIISYTSPCSCFRDITTGTAGTFSATVGWDFVTGLGIPNIRNLICALENH
ncbi:hypothetical protein [Clostridium sp.]|uniref:hypothetical protein n=1 Tax=Clostridium sp. TaxID=1506 RepID=UPI003F34700C